MRAMGSGSARCKHATTSQRRPTAGSFTFTGKVKCMLVTLRGYVKPPAAADTWMEVMGELKR